MPGIEFDCVQCGSALYMTEDGLCIRCDDADWDIPQESKE